MEGRLVAAAFNTEKERKKERREREKKSTQKKHTHKRKKAKKKALHHLTLTTWEFLQALGTQIIFDLRRLFVWAQTVQNHRQDPLILA